MNYLVRAWKSMNGKQHDDLYEFETLDEAKEFADWKADNLRKHGYEFDVRIYELTNY